MNFDVSIIVPTIRTHLLERFVRSVENACKEYSSEIVFISPFKTEIVSHIPIKWVASYSSVPVCLQLGGIEAEGKLLFHTVDDGVLLENSLDIALSQYNKECQFNDILNCRYMEGKDFNCYEFPEIYWRAGSYPHIYGAKYVDPDWRLSLQPLLSREFYVLTGGMDCEPEYSNFGHSDISFRCQQNSGKIVHSCINITKADHGQNDHEPIQSAQEGPDKVIFDRWWNNPRPNIINYEDYKQYDKIWERRFKDKYSSYEDLCKGENYKN